MENQTGLNKCHKPFILRYFKQGDNDKIITAIQRKIYFAKDQNIEPGYYVGSIVEDHERHGVIETIPLSKLPLQIWHSNQVSGVFIRADKKNQLLKIYLSKHPENKDVNEEPIYKISLSNDDAEILWGKNWKESIVSKKNGIKSISTDGYTPYEKMKKIIEK